MKKIKLKDVLIIIWVISFTICATIYSAYLISVVYKLSIDSVGLNIGLVITVVIGCIFIALIVLCVICAIKVIQCILFYK